MNNTSENSFGDYTLSVRWNEDATTEEMALAQPFIKATLDALDTHPTNPFPTCIAAFTIARA